MPRMWRLGFPFGMVLDWIGRMNEWVQRLSQPNVAFSGLPACPYAAQAKWTTYESDAPLLDALAEGADRLVNGNWDALLYLVPEDIKPPLETVVTFTDYPDVVAMLSDPHDPMMIAGYRTTQHERRIYILQSKSALAEAREKLPNDYYKNWTTSQLVRVGVDLGND